MISQDPRQRNLVNILLFVLLSSVIISIFILGSVPPVSRDALTHHLFVPKLWIQNGNIAPIPEIPFSYYPMNLELLYTIPLYWGNDIFPKYIHFSFALATAFLIYNYLKENSGRLFALLGVIFFLSIPIIVKLSITVYVDLGLMFFSNLSLFLLLKWSKSNYKYRYLFFAAISCGLAAGSKYNGLITIFILSLFTPLIYTRTTNTTTDFTKKCISYFLAFFIITISTFSPWLIRNYILTNNPIYPLHDTFFKNIHKKAITFQEDIVTNHESKINLAPKKNVFVTRKILYDESWWQTLLLPIRFFFEGEDGHPKSFDGKLNPFLFLLPFFAFIRKSNEKNLKLEMKFLLYFSVLFFFITFFQGVLRVRYIACIIPPLAILSIFGLQNISYIFRKLCPPHYYFWLMLVGLFIPCAMLAYNFIYIVQQVQVVQPLSYLSREVSRDQYISRFYPEYPVIQYANNNLQAGARVLCLFLGNRGYYMDFIPVFDRPTRPGVLRDILSSSQKVSDIISQLQEKDIECILLRNDLVKNWLNQLNERERRLMASFFQDNSKTLSNNRYYSLLSIK